MCQKFSGGPFGAFIDLNKCDFNFTSGLEFVKEYKSSQSACRKFCSECGSSLIYFSHEYPDVLSVSAGAFEDDPGVRPSRHIFVKDQCPWFKITDDLKQVARS